MSKMKQIQNRILVCIKLNMSISFLLVVKWPMCFFQIITQCYLTSSNFTFSFLFQIYFINIGRACGAYIYYIQLLTIMDIEKTYPQLIIKANHSNNCHISQLPSPGRVHFVPAIAKENAYGAKVSNYFCSTIKNHEHHQNCLQATLLGHELVGQPHQTPSLCDTFLMKDGNQLTVTLLRRIDQVVDWRKDRPWGPNDGPLRNIEKYVDIQAALHNFQN